MPIARDNIVRRQAIFIGDPFPFICNGNGSLLRAWAAGRTQIIAGRAKTIWNFEYAATRRNACMMPPVQTIIRAFVDTPDGQIHVRMSGPRDSDLTPLILLHQSPASSLTYNEILPLFGQDRWTIAIDTPGFGESFRPKHPPAIADYADWIVAAATALGIVCFDLLGLFTGAGIASEIAARHAVRVRRLVLAGPPLFTPEQQAGFVDQAWPVRQRPDGSHLIQEWRRVMDRPMPGVSFERRCDAFNEYYRGGDNAIWGEQAIAVYPLRETLPRIPAPIFVIEPQGIHGDCAGAAALLPTARFTRIAYPGYAMMQAIPENVAECVTAFLDDEDVTASPS